MSRTLRRGALAALVVFAGAAEGQSVMTTGIAAVDSAAAARGAWADALRAMRSNDTLAAMRAVDRAADAWPLQPTYLWARALIAAQRGDSLGAARALDAYAALGLGGDLSHRAFSAFHGQGWLEARQTRHAGNRAPLARSRVVRVLADSTLWPEGLDHDPRTGNWYVTSVRHGVIVEVSRDGREREVWDRHGAAARGAVLAVRVDPRGDRLWATVSGVPQAGAARADPASAALLEVRISDGTILRRFDLQDGKAHALGDVAVAPDGTVLVSDSNDPVLYLLRPGMASLEALRSPLFRSLQGIAVTSDRRMVYLADYSHGILRVDLDSREVTRVGEAPDIATLGVDGLRWTPGALIAVQNGVAPARVMRFELSHDGARIERATVLDRNPLADEPTAGAIVGSEFVYVANSQWEKHDGTGAPRPGALLRGTTLLAVPIALPTSRP